MKTIRSVEFHTGSREEKIPGFHPDFPYIASRVDFDYFREAFVPWHWHKAVEIFYMESGELRYCTPNGTAVFPKGSGGMVNSNVLHMTKTKSHRQKNMQYIHIFDPDLLAGKYGNLIQQKYLAPITGDSRLEMIALYPDDPKQAKIIQRIRRAFQIQETEPGYELRIREAMTGIWLELLKISLPEEREKPIVSEKSADKIKAMMLYIQEHYAEKISVQELAASVFLSERECYRVFQQCLHMTPLEYMKSYRLQAACQMLVNSQEPVTEISQACGMGSGSYFGKKFREYTGCTPREYRRKWQDSNKK